MKNNSSYGINFGLSGTIKTNFFDLSTLNDRLKLYNYPLLAGASTSFGSQIFIGKISDRLIYKLANDLYSETKENDSKKVKFNSTEISFDYGINILNKKRFFIYPVVGLGFSSVRFKIYDKYVVNRTFNQAISNLNGSSQINSSQRKIDLNLGANFDWALTNKNDFFIGLDVGYKFQLSKIKWDSNSSNLDNAPNINLSCFYIGLHLILF